MATEVEIAFPISHDALTSVEEFVQGRYCTLKVRSPSLNCAISGVETTPKRKIPFFDIRFSTDREPEGGEICRFRSDFTLSGEGGSPLHCEKEPLSR